MSTRRHIFSLIAAMALLAGCGVTSNSASSNPATTQPTTMPQVCDSALTCRAIAITFIGDEIPGDLILSTPAPACQGERPHGVPGKDLPQVLKPGEDYACVANPAGKDVTFTYRTAEDNFSFVTTIPHGARPAPSCKVYYNHAPDAPDELDTSSSTAGKGYECDGKYAMSGGMQLTIRGPKAETVTSATKARDLLEEYCGTAKDVALNCDFTGANVTPVQSELKRYGSYVKNCDPNQRNPVVTTVSEKKTYSVMNGLEAGVETEDEAGIPLFASVKVKISAKYSHTWTDGYEFDQAYQLTIDPGLEGGWYISPGQLKAVGRIVIRTPKGVYTIPHYTYLLPLKEDVQTDNSVGSTIYALSLENRIWPCQGGAKGPLPASHPGASIKETRHVIPKLNAS